MEFTISFFRPGKSWNLSVAHGKSWKMTKNDVSKNNKAKIYLERMIIFALFGKQLLNFRSWKTSKKSWKRS